MVIRIIIIILLLAIIAFCASFILFRYYGNQDKANWFNINFREKITTDPVLRDFYGLHWDGDARSDYLSNQKFQKLIVEIDAFQNCYEDWRNLPELSKKINDLVQKTSGVEIIIDDILDDDELIFLESNSMDKAADGLEARKRQHQSKEDTAVFYVLCLDRNRDDSDSIGYTYREDTALLFYDAISDFSAGNVETLSAYLETTLLHELGHQLGLSHVDDPNCIMAESVEEPGNIEGTPKSIPQAFCQSSLDRLEVIRSSYIEK